eukprot:GHVH01001170.1.p1 GENE.GHVH01001170.1~~GHVH01001170.1.p1  ORF type:complete len:335 (+),score=17.08 GHVH01001170.1:975-1979(+)
MKQTRATPRASHPEKIRTVTCRHWKRGHCELADRCNFRHDDGVNRSQGLGSQDNSMNSSSFIEPQPVPDMGIEQAIPQFFSYNRLPNGQIVPIANPNSRLSPAHSMVYPQMGDIDKYSGAILPHLVRRGPNVELEDGFYGIPLPKLDAKILSSQPPTFLSDRYRIPNDLSFQPEIPMWNPEIAYPSSHPTRGGYSYNAGELCNDQFLAFPPNPQRFPSFHHKFNNLHPGLVDPFFAQQSRELAEDKRGSTRTDSSIYKSDPIAFQTPSLLPYLSLEMTGHTTSNDSGSSNEITESYRRRPAMCNEASLPTSTAPQMEALRHTVNKNQLLSVEHC